MPERVPGAAMAVDEDSDELPGSDVEGRLYENKVLAFQSEWPTEGFGDLVSFGAAGSKTALQKAWGTGGPSKKPAARSRGGSGAVIMLRS